MISMTRGDERDVIVEPAGRAAALAHASRSMVSIAPTTSMGFLHERRLHLGAHLDHQLRRRGLETESRSLDSGGAGPSFHLLHGEAGAILSLRVAVGLAGDFHHDVVEHAGSDRGRASQRGGDGRPSTPRS